MDFIEKVKKNIAGCDRMIWIVAVMLMLFSLVAIFSSTSSLAIKNSLSRTMIFKDQVIIVSIGLFMLLAMSAIPNIKYIRVLSQFGFAVSAILLAVMVFGLKLGSFLHPIESNETTRAIRICGLSVQVGEVVKVAMVMYLSWAITTYERGKFFLTSYLAERFPEACKWMETLTAQRWIYLYIPMIVVVLLTFPGGTSSALMLAIVMGITLIIGGLPWKHVAGLIGLAMIGLLSIIGIHIMSNGKVIPRLQTGFNRLGIEVHYPSEEVRQKQRARIAAKKLDPEKIYEAGSKEFNEYRNKTLQNNGAEVAFVQGGRRIVGKGPGKSTQKYIVPLMFEDYMFSFIMEEYGLVGALLVILLYMSLFARGVMIVKYCSNRYAKTCVGGLVFLITFQAMFHILINCNVGVLTGQTLPMISHGKSSFLCFTIAFGVILAISRMAYAKIKKEGDDIVKEIEQASQSNESNN